MSAAEAYAREFCRSNNLDYERHKDSVANSWLENQHAALTDRLKKLQGKLDKANKKRSEYKELYKNLKDHTQRQEALFEEEYAALQKSLEEKSR